MAWQGLLLGDQKCTKILIEHKNESMAIEIGLSFIESDRVLVLARPFRFLLPPSVKMYCVLLRVFLREERVGERVMLYFELCDLK